MCPFKTFILFCYEMNPHCCVLAEELFFKIAKDYVRDPRNNEASEYDLSVFCKQSGWP